MREWPGEDVGVGEEGNRGASSFLFHFNTQMGGGAIRQEGEGFCGRSKVRECRNPEVKEVQEFHFCHLRMKCPRDIQVEMSNRQTNKYEITTSYFHPPPHTHIQMGPCTVPFSAILSHLIIAYFGGPPKSVHMDIIHTC